MIKGGMMMRVDTSTGNRREGRGPKELIHRRVRRRGCRRRRDMTGGLMVMGGRVREMRRLGRSHGGVVNHSTGMGNPM